MTDGASDDSNVVRTPIDNGAWHVGASHQERVTTPPPTAWGVVGAHLPNHEVPPRMRFRLGLDVTNPVDVEALRGPPFGSFWYGEAAARQCVSALQSVVQDGLSSAAAARMLAKYPGAIEIERTNIAKAGRLDGLPAVSYCWPPGYLERAWDGAPAGFGGDERELIENARLLAHWYHGRASRDRGSWNKYRTRFLSVRIDKHKGWPCFAGNINHDVSNAIGRCFAAMYEGEASIDDVTSYAASLQPWVREPVAVQFNRKQPSRKDVGTYSYDPAADGPVLRFVTTNHFPKIRDVWAFPAMHAWCARPGTGYVFGAIKAAGAHPADTLSVAALIRSRANADGEWLSLDYNGFDKSVSGAHLRAFRAFCAEMLKLEGLAGSRLEAGLELGLKLAEHIPILSPRHAPHSGAYVYWRDRLIVSGTPFTSLSGSVINALNLVRSYARTTGSSFSVALSKWGVDWCFATMGDDTIVHLSSAIDRDVFSQEMERDGFGIGLIPGINFLARSYDKHGSSVPSVGSLTRNAFFKEERSRATDPRVAALGLRAAYTTLVRPAYGDPHPLSGLFESALRRVADPYFVRALQWSDDQALTVGQEVARTPLAARDINALLDSEQGERAMSEEEVDGEDTRAADDLARLRDRMLNRRTSTLVELRDAGKRIHPDWRSAMDLLVETGNTLPSV